MRSERRIGRPFLIDSRVKNSLSKITLKYPDGTDHHASTTRLIPPPRSLRDEEGLRIHLAIDRKSLDEGLTSQGLSPNDVTVSLIASMDRLRRAEEILALRLSDITDDEFEIDLTRIAPLWVLEAMMAARLSLSVYLCLAQSVEADQLRPSVQSTWLSRAKFHVGISEPSYAVTIQPLGEDQYESGVPRGAYCYLEIDGMCTQKPASDFKVVVYLDADVFGTLKQYESSPGSTNAQAKLELIVLEGLLHRIVSDCNTDDISASDWASLCSQDPNPAVVGMIKSISKSAEIAPEEFFRLLLDDTEIAISYVGKVLKVAKQDIELMTAMTDSEVEL